MSVTAYLNKFQALSEFWHHTDTCGETAFLVLQHLVDGIPLSGPSVDGVRADMAAHHYGVNGGTDMASLVAYFRDIRKLDAVYANRYGDSLDNIHKTLLEHAGRDGIVLQVNRAYNLTGNERGVNSHFVAIGGIHPTQGYLVANGDDVRATNAYGGHGKIIPCRWMSWATIASAEPVAVALVMNIPHTVV
jgi:hypothetical protein